MYTKSLKPMMMIAALGLAVGCSSKKDDNTSNESSDSELKSLGLSGVIDVKVPNSVSGKTDSSSLTGLNLAGGAKSLEACQLRDQVKEGLAQISQLGDTFCRIESFKEIVPGKKYNISFKMPEGGGETPPSGAPPALLEDQPSMPSMQLFIDDSKGDDVVVYRCLDRKLVDLIKMKKDGDKRFGRFITKGSFSGGGFSTKFHASASFYKEGDVKTEIIIKDKMSITQNGEESTSSRILRLDLAGSDGTKEGISEVASSYSGKFAGVELNFSSAAIFGPDYGSIVQKYGDFGYRAYFDNSDLTRVSRDDHPDQFGEGKPYDIKPEKMPKKLSPTFDVKDFPADAWDCKDTEELELTITEEVINSCDANGFEMPEQTCSGSEFGYGDTEEFDEADFQDAEDFEKGLPVGEGNLPDVGE